MKNLLGGKGANLAEMNLIGVPVPPGFTITTEVCTEYNTLGREAVVKILEEDVKKSVAHIEKLTGNTFGDAVNPLLVSVRSGARVSMPGMMDTVLNLGINDTVVEALSKKSGNPRFAWDSYRRFVQMYGDVVLGMKPKSKQDIDPFEEILDKVKEEKGVKNDTELTVDDLKGLVVKFKAAVKKSTGKDFPESAWEQLWGAIYAVFDSWMNERAILYRRMNQIPEEWGTAVNVQAMVYGNMGNTSATGVAFTRDAATGEDIFNGEYLINAQGEDVVAGVRTPQQITTEGSRRWAALQGISEEERASKYPSLEESMPECAKELIETQQKLEDYFKDMQDLEFTIQDNKLWLLQTRNGKRTGAAMVKIAMDLLRAGEIDEKTVLRRMEPQKLDELLHPVFDKDDLKRAKTVAKGLPASPGAATGQIVFFADDAEAWSEMKKKVIMVRIETSPEDLRGMSVAQGILTARGGMTSHAAVVARGMGKCCVSGAGEIKVDYKEKTVIMDGKTYKEGDWISLNGSTGDVYDGQVPTVDAELSGDFAAIMNLAEKYTKVDVRTNADSPRDALVARKFGAKGIGLCRTEHMFFEEDRIAAFREMICSDTVEEREEALDKILPYQQGDFEKLYEALEGCPVTIRFLDPPLHEFVPTEEADIEKLAKAQGKSVETIKNIIASLHEFNPMMGHRGCRLAVTYPEIAKMQTKAVIRAAINVKKAHPDWNVEPEIMIPLVCEVKELKYVKKVVVETADAEIAAAGIDLKYEVGTMIEIPRAALTADEIAKEADFFCFGTNDLTQMTFGFSRDDAGKFLNAYYDAKIFENDPFAKLDQTGVGKLMDMAIKLGKPVNPKLHVGICGEHGGDPSSVEFCHKIGLDYVSCSPFRVPIARLAAAQAAIADEK